MLPGVCDTPPATPALPRWPEPTGQLTATPLPYCDFHVGLAVERYSVKLYVVPELSERCTIAIFVPGSFTPLFNFLIAGSSHCVIWPEKIFASVAPFMSSRFLTPPTF